MVSCSKIYFQLAVENTIELIAFCFFFLFFFASTTCSEFVYNRLVVVLIFNLKSEQSFGSFFTIALSTMPNVAKNRGAVAS